ncbi:tRNA 2-thiouridine(34) synthase MnmA [Patescibacteria group bacterium]|nr:tRNA 2-thiouridine(34) synthase MnmA [Patescibacteria group bacterium]
MINKNEKIVVGMSGGVDSSIALILLKEQGWDPIGVSLKYAIWPDKANCLRENVCCSKESFATATNICKKLKVPYHVLDVSADFKKQVIEYFVKELKNNRTPNPCIRCNPSLKFKQLFKYAKKHNIKYVATGHFAQSKVNKKTGKHELLKAKDNKKDQTYSLSWLPQKWLKYIKFPLGKYTKQQVFKLAIKHGFDFFIKQKQSQDFCFVAGKSMVFFLKKELGIKSGQIKDTKGNLLGEHNGLHFYTIGQRKGINLSGGPYFVVKKNNKENVLIVSKQEKDLYSKQAILSPVHFISGESLEASIKVQVKIRSQHIPSLAYLTPLTKNKIKLNFIKSQKAITLGQFAVFYKANVCLGGGEIKQ